MERSRLSWTASCHSLDVVRGERGTNEEDGGAIGTMKKNSIVEQQNTTSNSHLEQ